MTPASRASITRRELVRRFLAGRSMLGLARRHGYTLVDVEAIVRGWPGRPRRGVQEIRP